MQTTPNYGLKKPEGTDLVDIDVLNSNMDTLDTQLKAVSNAAGEAMPSTWRPAWGDVTGKPSTFTPASHNHSVANITSGTLAVARGGTGQTSVQALRNAMGLGNTTGALPIANGGTGATTAAAARTTLGAVANYIVSVTIPTGTWTADTGGGYYKDITVANMTATAPAKLDFAQSSDKAAGELMVSEFLANILRIEQMAGKVRVHTYKSGKAPSVNIPVRLSWTA